MKWLGRLALAILIAACSTEAPRVTRDWTAYTGTLPAVGGAAERTARLTLRDNGTAAVQLSSPGPAGDYFADGKWQQVENAIVIELSGAAPARLVFRRSGDLLIGKEWDRALWGDKEPVLYVVR